MKTSACNSCPVPLAPHPSAPGGWAAMPHALLAVWRGARRVPMLLRRLMRLGAAPAQAPSAVRVPPQRGVSRVDHLGLDMPLLTFRHPLRPGEHIRLRALDIGARGCTIIECSGVLPLIPGSELRAVEVELDDEFLFFADLIVQKVSPPEMLGPDGPRVRLRWHHMPAPAQERLARWLAHHRFERKASLPAPS